MTDGAKAGAEAERDRRREPGGRGGRSVPRVARVLKRFIREARLHTLAGAERFPSPADWLAELARAAAAFSVAPNVPASEVLFTDPASWRSGDFRESLDARAQKWPKGSPPCGFLCWVAHDVEGRDVNGKTRGAGHVRVTSPVVSHPDCRASLILIVAPQPPILQAGEPGGAATLRQQPLTIAVHHGGRLPLIIPHRIGPSLGYGMRRTGDGKEALQAGGDRQSAAAG